MLINSVKAVSTGEYNIVSGGNCGKLLMYKGIEVECFYAHVQNDLNRPAYCLDKTKHGVKDGFSYPVSVENVVSDVKLWRILINGYPYKSIAELGCSNKEEAFTATKQAIYCYLHENEPSDYTGIGDAGNRALNALKMILENANNSNEIQISNIVDIVKEENNFDIDKIDNNFVSKVYLVKAGATISNYKIELEKGNADLPEGIKVVDVNNMIKTDFSQGEKFKILIPIKSLTKDATFKIKVKTTINSKPVLYGRAGGNDYQDYAITSLSYEDASGSSEDNYHKNDTKIKIIKQDKETKERLENVEFNIYDENKNIIYANLKTNKDGEIEINNFLPGKYYIQESKSKDGYNINNDFTEFIVDFNQSLILEVDNSKIINKNIKEVVMKKLPITGM